jgi:2-amino-4-hydroxy-6-hydroxymethyldihydropteridine diphosphokinase
MERIYLGLGSNMGRGALAPQDILLAVAADLANVLGKVRLSSIWKSRARHVENQPDFRNAVLEAETELWPRDLLILVNRLEAEYGRNRSLETFKGPRSLDIDILLYGSKIHVEPDLVIPHPLMRERKFVLLPLAELAPELADPVSGRSFLGILGHLPAQGICLAQIAPDVLFYP